MQFSGKIFTTSFLEDSYKGKLIQVNFDLPGTSVNIFNDAVFAELNQVLERAENDVDLGGLVFTSSKKVFVAGADISILLHKAKHESSEEIAMYMARGHDVFNRLQALPVATVAAINGAALGGGLEFALAMDARVMAMQARAGLPEVSLGIFPGWGGTVRLPRLIAPEVAAQWIAYGKPHRPHIALRTGLVAAITTADDLLNTAIAQLKVQQPIFDQTRAAKMQPVDMSDRSREAISKLLADLDRFPGKDYPAARSAIRSMLSQQALASLPANEIEARDFSQILLSDSAINLLSVFMNDQAVGRRAREYAAGSGAVKSLGVLGAGTTGCGIAGQAAMHNIPVAMKGSHAQALHAGMQETERNLSALVAKHRLDEVGKENALSRIRPTLRTSRVAKAQVIVEAADEDMELEQSQINELEVRVADDAVLALNTSTLSISRLAEKLQRPENFCGLHFLDPVSAMPLVEIVRGKQTSEQTISRMAAFALQLGKKPVVVNDCPGLLVNRILFAFINAVHIMIDEGVDFQFIDRLMVDWGWPMGPAHQIDVIGVDTVVHSLDRLAAAVPGRMTLAFESASHLMLKHKRLGEKNALGFYRYSSNELGRAARQVDETSMQLLYQHTPHVLTPDEVTDRLIGALCLEAVRCLQEQIVASPAELDMALLWGLGFPRFRGGAIRHIDTIGIEAFCHKQEKYQNLGSLYSLPELLVEKRDSGSNFYQ